MLHELLKPGLDNFEHYFTSIWDECNCTVVCAFLGIAFLWDWNEHWPFPVLWPLLSFPNLLAYWVQHFYSSSHQQKIGLKLYWAWNCPSEQDSFSPSVSLSYQEASLSVLSFCIRGQTDWNPQPQETNQSDHMNHSLCDSMKLWAMPCRATQDGWGMLEYSDKMWSTGEGNDKPLQYSCLENSMNSMKRQKYRTLKDKLPRLVGAQYATGDQWRKTPERMKRQSQSKNNTQVCMWLVMEARSDAVKSNIAWQPGMLGPWIKANWKWSNRRWQEWTSTF